MSREEELKEVVDKVGVGGGEVELKWSRISGVGELRRR